MCYFKFKVKCDSNTYTYKEKYVPIGMFTISKAIPNFQSTKNQMHNIVVVRKTVYKVKCDQNTYANRKKSSDIQNYVCLVFIISKTIPNSQPIYQCCIAAFPLGNFPPPNNLLHVSSAPFPPGEITIE